MKKTFGLIAIGLFILAFLRSYIRIETTLIGYKIGELKSSESSSIEERNHLRMKLAKLTSKESLLFYSKLNQ